MVSYILQFLYSQEQPLIPTEQESGVGVKHLWALGSLVRDAAKCGTGVRSVAAGKGQVKNNGTMWGGRHCAVRLC